jgi:hypothetical protein
MQRRELLTQSAAKTVKYYNTLVTREHGIEEAFILQINDTTIPTIVDYYFFFVGEFKKTHKVSGQVNQSKRAALMLEAMLHFDLSGLFAISPSLSAKDKKALDHSLPSILMAPEFIYLTVCNILDVDVRKIPNQIKKDLFVCFRDKLPISREWASLTMWFFCESSGKPNGLMAD